MKQNFSRWSFLISMVCLGFSVDGLWTKLSMTWSVSPPVPVLLALAVVAFVFAVIGSREVRNGSMALASVSTVLLSLGLTFVLAFVAVLPIVLPASRQLIGTAQSPDQHYKLQFYLTNGGAMTSLGVIGELEGPLWFKKTIYKDQGIDHAAVTWPSGDTIVINGHKLHLNQGQTYDFAEAAGGHGGHN